MHALHKYIQTYIANKHKYMHTLHFHSIPFHFHFHSITLRYVTLRCVALHYTTLHACMHTCMHTCTHFTYTIYTYTHTLHCITLHYSTPYYNDLVKQMQPTFLQNLSPGYANRKHKKCKDFVAHSKSLLRYLRYHISVKHLIAKRMVSRCSDKL